MAAATSTTLYVGNLAFVTTEQQVMEVFRRCGPVKQVIMGLNRSTRKPCGFCFVIYYRRDSLVAAMNYLNGSKLDNRYIRLQVDKVRPVQNDTFTHANTTLSPAPPGGGWRG